LRDSIKRNIAAGELQDGDRLPGIMLLAREMKINFDTIRRAYKDLEKEGIIVMERGRGTFVTLSKNRSKESPAFQADEKNVHEEAKAFIRKLISETTNAGEARKIINKAFEEISSEMSRRYIIYTEHRSHRIENIARGLTEHIKIDIKPVAISELKGEIQNAARSQRIPIGIVTTGFYANDVRKIIGELPIELYVVATNMSSTTRKKLEKLGRNTHFGFFCRDKEALHLYKDQIKNELPDFFQFMGCTLKDESKAKRLLNSVSVALVTSRGYDAVKRLAPPGLPIINVFDHVDRMSIRIVKEKILESLQHPRSLSALTK
jgi:GntR family transcriptional regulator